MVEQRREVQLPAECRPAGGIRTGAGQDTNLDRHSVIRTFGPVGDPVRAGPALRQQSIAAYLHAVLRDVATTAGTNLTKARSAGEGQGFSFTGAPGFCILRRRFRLVVSSFLLESFVRGRRGIGRARLLPSLVGRCVRLGRSRALPTTAIRAICKTTSGPRRQPTASWS